MTNASSSSPKKEKTQQRLVPWVSLVIVLTAVVYQVAPGEPAWLEPKDLTSMMQSSSSASSQETAYIATRFTGGDGKTMLGGRLYLPATTKEEPEDADENKASSPPPPVIILAHGLGLTQSSGLQPYIDAFTENQFAVFTFDYATFGINDGWPRHQVKPVHQVYDLRAAVSHLQTTEFSQPIDATRMALWGTSMGGGHVLYLASRMHYFQHLRAVVAQVPHVKSAFESILAMLWRDPYHTATGLLKVTGALLKYLLHGVFFQQTLYIPLVGQPGSAAMMQNPGDAEGYLGLVGETPVGWQNWASVGSVLPTLMYRPFNRLDKIVAPTLLIPAADDTLCPAADSVAAADRIPSAQLVQMQDVGHFDVYTGKVLEEILTETVRFFKEHLDQPN